MSEANEATVVRTEVVDKRMLMTQRKTKTVHVEELGFDITISKLKAGQWKKIQEEAVDAETKEVDAIKSMAMVIPACMVDPVLTEEDVDSIDTNVLIDIATEIMAFSGLTEEVAAAKAAKKSDVGERGA